MFIEETKFCPKCGQELKDKKCPNCDFRVRLSDLFVTKKMFLLSFSLLFFVNSVLSCFCCTKIISYQVKKTTERTLLSIGKSLGCDWDSNIDNKKPTQAERDKFIGPTPKVLATIGNEQHYLGLYDLGIPDISTPYLKIYASNGEAGKTISALKFYVTFYNVYGEEIKSLQAKNYYLADRPYEQKFTFPFLSGAKTAKVYLYSVYFDDGTEWGDRNAERNTILECGKEIPVDGEFQ